MAMFGISLLIVFGKPQETRSACTGVATVDISSYVNGHGDNATKLAFDEAMKSLGMVCITGHGVKSDEVEAEAANFFAQDLETKMKSGDLTYGTDGYTPRGVEAVARSTGAASAPDAVESYVFRRRPDWSASAKYWDDLLRLLNVLLEIKKDVFQFDFTDYFTDDDTSLALRLASYPELPDPTVFRYGLHTDYLTFTILRATDPGLEVQLPNGTFVAVGPDPNSLIVNAGDLTDLWTNGKWRSAPHRVVPVPSHNGVSRPRSALVFFTGPSLSKLISPILSDDDLPRYDPVIAGDYLHYKISPTTVVQESSSSSSSCDSINSDL